MAPSSLVDVLDAGGRVCFELTAPFPKQELDGAKILLIDPRALVKLISRKRLEVVASCLRFIIRK